jgi:hypothetical protein
MNILHAIGATIADQIAAVRAVNRRYAEPRLKMSPAARWSLLALRIYLLVLVGLLAYKFVTLVTF